MVQREILMSFEQDQASTAEKFKRSQSDMMEVEARADQMGDKNPIRFQRRDSMTGYAFAEDD